MQGKEVRAIFKAYDWQDPKKVIEPLEQSTDGAQFDPFLK